MSLVRLSRLLVDSTATIILLVETAKLVILVLFWPREKGNNLLGLTAEFIGVISLALILAFSALYVSVITFMSICYPRKAGSFKKYLIQPVVLSVTVHTLICCSVYFVAWTTAPLWLLEFLRSINSLVFIGLIASLIIGFNTFLLPELFKDK